MKNQKSGRTFRLTVILYLFAEFILEWLRVEWPDVGVTREIVFGEVRFNQLVLMALLLFFAGLSLYRAKHPVTAAVPEPDEEKPDEATEQPEETSAEPSVSETEQPEEAPNAEPSDMETEQPEETHAETSEEAVENPEEAADGGEGNAE